MFAGTKLYFLSCACPALQGLQIQASAAGASSATKTINYDSTSLSWQQLNCQKVCDSNSLSWQQLNCQKVCDSNSLSWQQLNCQKVCDSNGLSWQQLNCQKVCDSNSLSWQQLNCQKVCDSFYVVFERYRASTRHLVCKNVWVFMGIWNLACKRYRSSEINHVYGYIYKCMFSLRLQISVSLKDSELLLSFVIVFLV